MSGRGHSDSTRAVHAGLPAPVVGEPFLPGPVFAAPYHLDPVTGPGQHGYARTEHPTRNALEAAIGKIERLGDLTPRGIRTCLELNRPIYQPTAAYGHFGRKTDGGLFPWEKTDLVDELKAALA